MGFGFGFSVSFEETPPYLNEMVRVQGSGFRVYASWFVVYGLWLTVDGIGLRHSVFSCRVSGSNLGLRGGREPGSVLHFLGKCGPDYSEAVARQGGLPGLVWKAIRPIKKSAFPKLGEPRPKSGA